MNSNIRGMDLRKINSLTKYPSILTYHEIGEKGRLQPTTTTRFEPSDEMVVTEKIDGTNARAIIFPQGETILYGSREELLHAKGDLIANPSQGIVEALVPFITKADFRPLTVIVVYGEVFGIRGLPNSKQYSVDGKPGFSVFDMVEYPSLREFLLHLEQPIEKISAWRDNSGEIPFASEARLKEIVRLWAPLAPRISSPGPLPTGIPETHEWLKQALPGKSNAMLDPTAKGQPEGVVVRTPDRKKVVKLRFEDYQRAARG
jgi:hypothetical protein